MAAAVAIAALAAWLGLWLGRAGFWRIERDAIPPEPSRWPDVVAVIPARDEAAVIGEAVRSLLRQEYPGSLRVVVVDDDSTDSTAECARSAARKVGRESDVTVVGAEPLPMGWTGKVWAMHQGITRGAPAGEPSPYVLFTDADVVHGPVALRELVSRAEAGACDLVSFMVQLECRSAAERLMIPAFVFFFRMLYPFPRVNNPADSLAGAAGGAMLVRREALERIGWLVAIRSELIDDCALAARVKRGGHRVWLGLSDSSRSIRGYGGLAGILDMISRTAYTQLGYSPLRLAGCVVGLALTFLAPPLLTFLGHGWPQIAGAAAWILMSLLYLPMVRFYRQSPALALLLPITALLYLWATVLSAWEHHHGRGGQWKGRSQSPAVRG